MKHKVERVSEQAFFVVDLQGFQSTIARYDPLSAEGTILENSSGVGVEEEYVEQREDLEPVRL